MEKNHQVISIYVDDDEEFTVDGVFDVREFVTLDSGDSLSAIEKIKSINNKNFGIKEKQIFEEKMAAFPVKKLKNDGNYTGYFSLEEVIKILQKKPASGAGF